MCLFRLSLLVKVFEQILQEDMLSLQILNSNENNIKLSLLFIPACEEEEE